MIFVAADGCVEATLGWEGESTHWLDMDRASLRRFRPSWVEEAP